MKDLRPLIVGGTAGIGLASARRILRNGARRMVVAGRNARRGASAAEMLRDESGASVEFIACDASDTGQLEALVAESVRSMGGIDFLLSCGGGDPMPRLLHEIPLDRVIPIMNELQAALIQPARAVLEVMSRQGHGSIVVVASDAGKLATPGETPIGAAMASVIMFCRAMANEVKRNGIRVNCVTPSIVRNTLLYEKLMADAFCGKLFGKAEKMASLGVVEPEDLAEIINFLASPASARMTGQAISVTGGISAI